jgi:CRP/FNR family transcriptional regulator, cyclic AMP receptor protein
MIMARHRNDFRKVSLKKIPIFQSLSSASIKKIEGNITRHNFSKGDEIVARNEGTRDVFILLSGVARVLVFSASGKAVSFRHINPGDIFGEFSAIDGLKRSASVEAIKPCAVASFSGTLFWELMETDRTFLNVVLNHLVDLLRSLTARIVEFSTLAVKNRIHCEILRIAKSARGEEGECCITPAPTHLEIAARISTHREAVSREFSRMKQIGLIERRGRTLVVKDFGRLEQMVHDAVGEELMASLHSAD